MTKRLLILFACVFVLMIGYGLTLPVLSFYIERLALSEGATSAEASFQVGLLTGIFAFMQFLFAPFWGKWSDRLGRRPLFLIGLGGYAISAILFGVGTNLAMLYTARITGGILSAAVLPVANAYVTDLTSEQERGRGMAWLGSATGLGIVVGPALGAFLSQVKFHATFQFGHFRIDGFSLPFFTAALLSLLTLGAALYWLPEPLGQKPPVQPAQGKRVQTQPFIRRVLPGWIRPFLVLAFLYQFALAMFEGTFALHAKQIIQFGPSEMGVVFVTCGFVMAAAQVAVVARLIGRVGEKPLLPAGFLLMAAGLALLMTTQRMEFIIFYVAVLAFGVALIAPTLAALVSKRAGAHAGAALGQFVAANSLGQAIGPIVGSVLFTWQIHVPYVLTALLLVATAVYIIVPMFSGPAARKSEGTLEV